VSTTIVTNRLPILAGEIKTALAATRAAATVTLTSAILAGERLIEAKALVAHGQWLPWLEEHCELSVRSAQVYMRLAKNNTQPTAHLTIDAALEALAAPARTSGDFVTNAIGKLDTAEETMRAVVRVVEEQPDADKVEAMVVLKDTWLEVVYHLPGRGC